MTSEKKNKYLQWIQTITVVLSFFLLIFGGYKGAIAWGKYTENQKNIQDQRMFKDAEQRIKTRNHVNSPWTEYVVRMKTDTLIKQQKVVLTAFDSFNVINARDEEDKVSRIKSRARRDSIGNSNSQAIQDIQREQKNSSNAYQSILDELREIKLKQNSNDN